MSLNTRFSNCFDFINDMKKVVESDRDHYDNIYMEESIFYAECDLMEMEIEAAYDAEMYDSIMETNTFRTSKKASRRKQNKKNKERDRIHGKHRELTRKEQELVHYDATKGVHGAGVWYTCRGKKIVPIVSKGKKTNRNYYEKKYSYPAKEREQEYI